MRIEKIFNNNSIMAKQDDGAEVVLIGCGLAFGKKVADVVNEALIEKTFVLKEKDILDKFTVLLEDIPSEYAALCYDIIEYAKNMLKCDLNDYIYITLTDHINYTLKLVSEGIYKPNILALDIEKFYPKEYRIGLKALELIEDELGIVLSKDEAANIALHLITAQIDDKALRSNDAYKMTQKIHDIMNIVKYAYNIELDERSVNYERFVTHLRFFFKRLKSKELYEDDNEDFLLPQVKKKYKSAYECMLRIQTYLNIQLSNDEQLYLTLHIQRVISR